MIRGVRLTPTRTRRALSAAALQPPPRRSPRRNIRRYRACRALASVSLLTGKVHVRYAVSGEDFVPVAGPHNGLPRATALAGPALYSKTPAARPRFNYF